MTILKAQYSKCSLKFLVPDERKKISLGKFGDKGSISDLILLNFFSVEFQDGLGLRHVFGSGQVENFRPVQDSEMWCLGGACGKPHLDHVGNEYIPADVQCKRQNTVDRVKNQCFGVRFGHVEK